MCSSSDKQLTPSHALQITVSKDDTIVLNGGGAPEALEDRCELIRASAEQTSSTYEKEKLQERLAKLSGGVAVIKVCDTPNLVFLDCCLPVLSVFAGWWRQ